jgi:hypothetical protein
VTAIE